MGNARHIAAGLVVLAALSGCSSNQDGGPRSGEEIVAATESPTAASTSYETEYGDAPDPVLSPNAKSTYRSADIDSATATIIELTEQYAWKDDVVFKDGDNKPSDILGARQYMTPSMAADYTRLVKKTLPGRRHDDLNQVTFVNASGEGVAFHGDGSPNVVNPTINSIKINDAGNGTHMEIALETSADLRALKNDRAVIFPTERTTTFWLVNTGTKGEPHWKVDGLQGTYISRKAIRERTG